MIFTYLTTSNDKELYLIKLPLVVFEEKTNEEKKKRLPCKDLALFVSDIEI